jgi:hypothetical protein
MLFALASLGKDDEAALFNEGPMAGSRTMISANTGQLR